MSFSQSDLRGMAAAASTIPERSGDYFLPGEGQADEKDLRARLHAWCQTWAGGDWQVFQARLSWDGYSLTSVQRLLAPGYWSELAALPSWTITLQEVLQQIETVPDASSATVKDAWPFLDTGKPLPFEELLAPFVSLAQRRLLAQLGENARLLGGSAHVTLQHHLLDVLASIAVPTLSAEFASTRSRHQIDATGSSNREGDKEQVIYRCFLEHMRQGGLATILRTYSVLARLLAETCDLWVESNVEMVQRLISDWKELSPLFGLANDLEAVIEIQPSLSDVHAGRRSVIALTFASGVRLVYKPRPMGTEEAFFGLLHWCNEQRATPPFKTLAVLNRSTYGWMEYVEYRPCQDEDALRRYWQRAGMLLCLVYLLGGADCFFDQIIAHGDQPVLVDTCNLLQAYASPHPLHRHEEAWEQSLYSMLHTGLLASWHIPLTGSQKRAAEISGLNMGDGTWQAPLPPHQQKLKYGSFKLREPLHIAGLVPGAKKIAEEELQAACCAGFQCMYQLLHRQLPALLSADSPLQNLKTQFVRFPYRYRSLYTLLFPKLLEPQALRDAVARSLLLEGLGWDCVPIEWGRPSKRDRAHWWAVFAAERQRLLQGDVPVLSARADSDALFISADQEVPSCLCQPPFDLLMTRLEQMSNEDMVRQSSLLTHAFPRRDAPVIIYGGEGKRNDLPDKRSEATFFEMQALSIADDIASRAIEIEHDSVIWINPAFLSRFQRYQLRPMRYAFSDGMSGIAFFLAALARQTGSERYRSLACAALRPLRRLLREDGGQVAQEMGLGAGLGLGSLIYALTRISQFLDEPELLVDARTAASLITLERVTDDNLLDVHLGAAGSILGLLALYALSPEQRFLDQAMWCGEHLLRNRTMSMVDCRAWPTLGGAHTTGFAHGTAGIVYALLRLYAVTGERDLLKAAQEGLHYEDHAFVAEKGNWVEVVGKEGADFGISWCHGAPGIGLARVGGLSMLDTPSIRRDIDVALQTTRRIGTAGLDHLCCGICGRIEFLLTTAQSLDRSDLADTAASWMDRLLARAGQRGDFTLNLLLPEWISYPQLFQGLSGIGYTLLRLDHPDALPSVLLWE